MKRQLIKYIRKNDKTPIGTLISFVEQDKIYIGWSLLNKKDEWHRYKGMKIAINRGYFYGDNETLTYPLAQSIKNDFIKMAQRSERFFKGAKLPSNVKEILGELNA